jgi:hypothetical protein
MNNDWRKGLFYIAALYDGVLGLLFLFGWSRVFDYFHIRSRTPEPSSGITSQPASRRCGCGSPTPTPRS